MVSLADKQQQEWQPFLASNGFLPPQSAPLLLPSPSLEYGAVVNVLWGMWQGEEPWEGLGQ